MANPFVHLELNTTDLKKAAGVLRPRCSAGSFRTIDMGPMGIYSTFKPDSGPGGGIYAAKDIPQQGWLAAYVSVDDIKAATAKAKSLGAQVFLESQEIPQVGWMTILNDPLGARVALFQPKM